jgi:hypothetical protein
VVSFEKASAWGEVIVMKGVQPSNGKAREGEREGEARRGVQGRMGEGAVYLRKHVMRLGGAGFAHFIFESLTYNFTTREIDSLP